MVANSEPPTVVDLSSPGPASLSLSAAVLRCVRDLGKHRWYISSSIQRDVRSRFSGSVLGGFWALVLPIIPVSAYLFLRLVFSPTVPEGALHPALYVCIGVTLWFLFADLIMLPMQAITRREAMLQDSSFPFVVVLLAEASSAIFDFVLRAVFVGVVCVWFLDDISWSAILLVPAVVGSASLCFCFGTYLMFCRFAFPDIEQITQILLRYLIFLSLAIFPLSGVDFLGGFDLWNPLALMINTGRELLTAQDVSHPGAFLGVTIIGILLIPITLRTLYAVSDRMREYL